VHHDEKLFTNFQVRKTITSAKKRGNGWRALVETKVKNFLVTGRPGIGKTTCLTRTVEILTSRGVSVGGMVTYEVREKGERIGFNIRDVFTGKEGVLARVGLASGPRVSKYTVNLHDLETTGVEAIRSALRECQVVVIDEIGPMELYSKSFLAAVTSALNSEKPVIATIHERAQSFEEGRRILGRSDVKLYTLTLANREAMPSRIAREVASLLSKK